MTTNELQTGTFGFNDWLGQYIQLGDYVTYARSCGRAVEVQLGQVKDIRRREDGTVKRVSVMRSRRSTRGTNSPGTEYIDKRTGKEIRWPWADGHIKEAAHYVDSEGNKHDPYLLDYWERQNLTYVPTVFNDYVEVRDRPDRPVHLSVIENITKVDTALAERYIAGE